MPRKSTTSYALPALIHVLLIGTTFSPGVRPVLVAAFGSQPFGYAVTWVVAIAQAIFLLPFVLGIHHFMLIAAQAALDGHSIGKIGLVAYVATVGQRHPHLRRSQLIAVAGLAYFMVVCGIWIAYADAKGI